MRNVHSKFAIGLTAAVVAVLGVWSCGGDDTSINDRVCISTVDDHTSPAPGVLTLKGSFYSNESILVRDVQTGTVVASGTPATNRDAFTFINVPSGTHSYQIIVSCSKGQDTLDTAVYVVQ